jgi:formate-dependent nitrite reductase membrane component NrfD
MGLLFLILELGRPERALLVFTNIGSSVMSWGSIIISIFSIITMAYLSFWIGVFPWSRWARVRRLIAEIGLVFAFATMAYTGFLLSAAGRPIWQALMTPLVFTLGGLSAGLAIVLAGAVAAQMRQPVELGTGRGQTPNVISNLFRIMMLLVVVDAIVLVQDMATIYEPGAPTIALACAVIGGPLKEIFLAPPPASASIAMACQLIGGNLSNLFWSAVAIGTGIPALSFFGVMYAKRKGNEMHRFLWILAASVAVPAGGLLFRYVVLAGGWTLPLLPSNTPEVLPVMQIKPFDLLLTAALLTALVITYFIGARFFLVRPVNSEGSKLRT